MEKEIHVLECLFYVNDIYFNNMVQEIEKKKGGLSAMEEGLPQNSDVVAQMIRVITTLLV